MSGCRAAPHRDEETIADQKLRFTEDRAFSLDLDRDGHDQDHIAVVDDLRPPVRFQHFFLVLVAGAKFPHDAGEQFRRGIAQSDPQHAGRLPLRLAVIPADVLPHLVDGNLAVAPSVHVGDRRDNLALVGVGETFFSGHGLPLAMRSLPNSLWASADDSPAYENRLRTRLVTSMLGACGCLGALPPGKSGSAGGLGKWSNSGSIAFVM